MRHRSTRTCSSFQLLGFIGSFHGYGTLGGAFGSAAYPRVCVRAKEVFASARRASARAASVDVRRNALDMVVVCVVCCRCRESAAGGNGAGDASCTDGAAMRSRAPSPFRARAHGDARARCRRARARW